MRIAISPGFSSRLAIAIVFWSVTSMGQDTSTIQAGMRLRAALQTLESTGLRVLYSGGIVRRRMRVETKPVATQPQSILDEILRPFGLMAAPAPNGAWVIVRTPDNAPPATASLAEPDLSDEPIEITPNQPRIEEIVVAASRYALSREAVASNSSLEQNDIEFAPVLGEDAIRVANRLPGMATNGVSSRSNVRGGEVDEMLVRFDGLRLYDPFHLKDFQGIFSTVDPRIVSSMDVYTGGYPAVFGNKMSGVIDVVTMAPPKDRYHELGLSFFNTSFLSSGVFADDKAEWVVSARRSNLDILYNTFSKQPERPGYKDTFAKISYNVNDQFAISGNVLYSSDDISLSDDVDREERAQADHKDSYVWLRLDHTLRTFFSGRTLLSHANLSSQRTGFTNKGGISSGSLEDRRKFTIDSLQTDWSYGYSEDVLFQFGVTAESVSGLYEYSDDVVFDLLFDLPGVPTEISRSRQFDVMHSGKQYGAYVNTRISATKRLTADLGIRWDAQGFGALDAATLSPRIGLRFEVSEKTDMRVSLGRYSQSQAINELQVSDGVTEFAKPQRSDHVVLGLTHRLASGLSLRVEGYEKRMQELRPRYENLLNSRILLPELKPDRIRIAPTSARTRGLEILVEKNANHETDQAALWWLGYSYAWVRDRIDGSTVLRSWDQTHALSAGVNWTLGRWAVASSLIYRTGWPISAAVLDASGSIPIASVTGRNDRRLGNYGSLDINLTRTFELDRGDLTLSIELINALDRKNECCVEYEIGDEEEAGQLLFKRLDYLPRIPSVGVIWKF